MALYVQVFVNNDMIFSKACQRIKEPDEDGFATYETLDKVIIKHNPKNGAKVLAKLLLDT